MDFVSEDTGDQAKQALTNMGAILEAAGSCFKNGTLCAEISVTFCIALVL